MKLNSLLSIYAMVAVIFCVGLLLLPSFWITLYGADADPQAALLPAWSEPCLEGSQ